jgi:hypothetical protein
LAPEWWLIDEPTQSALASVIDAAAARVIENFDLHGNENSLTAAFGEHLLQTHLQIGNTSVRFLYRNFSEMDEEPATGADGGIAVSINSQGRAIEKAVLFQAKRFPQDREVKSLSLPRADAKRLRHQIDRMIPITNECIVLAHTRERIYAIDGRCADRQSIDNLRYVTERCRLVSIGTFLGKWVARCSRGERGHYVVSNVMQPKGFIHHQLSMTIDTDQQPMLASGSGVLDSRRFDSPIQAGRRRR